MKQSEYDDMMREKLHKEQSEDGVGGQSQAMTPKPASRAREMDELRDKMAHKSEACHLPYDPQHSSEYHAYRRGFDAALGLSIPLEDVKNLIEALEFYAVGWNEKHARINDFKIAEKVFKNPAVQDDHGLRAKEALTTILNKFPQLKETDEL